MEIGMNIQQAMNLIVNGQHLSQQQAKEVMNEIMEGQTTPAQIGGLLTALRMKGETADEITGFAQTMREKANRVETENNDLLDVVGTGGSGIHKFNISTASAIISAACDVRVAKHGNRAMSGKSGSADVLEALGVNITLNSEQAAKCLDQAGICFMFAQVFHPAMKHVAGPRRELGIRTIFNMLGPLTNPAGADHQLVGLYDRTKTETIAHVLQRLGLNRAMVVSSVEGLDEISISAPTQISELKNGDVLTYEVTPDDFGLPTHPLNAVIGGDAPANAQLVYQVFNGEKSAYRDIVLANASACIYVTGRCSSFIEGVQLAAEAIDSGRALAKLQQLIQITGELSYVS